VAEEKEESPSSALLQERVCLYNLG
jgi:hypothetical protein